MATALNGALDQRAELKAEGNAILAIAANARTAKQTARLDAIEAEVGAVDREIDRLRKVQAAEKAEATGEGLTVTPRARGRRFAEMFPTVALDRGGFDSSEQFLATLHSGLADARLRPAYGSLVASSLTGGSGADGGFSVPTEFFRQWLDSSLESEIVRPRADIRPMASSDAAAPGWDDGDRSSTLYGGFSGQWISEASDITVELPKMRLINLKARKLAILTRASNELIADGVSFEEQLGAAISRALGYFLDTAFLTGTGAGQPLGILNAPATITVAAEGGQTADTINYTNVAKVFSRLAPSSVANSVWVCNSTAIPQLLTLTVEVGTGGSHIPVLTESNGTFRMLTRPVIFSEKAPALGEVGDIGLYDFSQYVVGMRADFALAKSQHAGFASDTSYYRGIIRCDGQPKLSAAITPANGDTVSPFVTLAAR